MISVDDSVILFEVRSAEVLDVGIVSDGKRNYDNVARQVPVSR